jgi:hypothetical protein
MPAAVPEIAAPQVSAVQLGRRRRATRPHAKVAEARRTASAWASGWAERKAYDQPAEPAAQNAP